MILYTGLLDEAHGCFSHSCVWRTLVWSKAWNAEGEKGKPRLFQAYTEESSSAGNFNNISEISARLPVDIPGSTRR